MIAATRGSSRAGAAGNEALGGLLVANLHRVARSQGSTGEIASLRRGAAAVHLPCRTPFVSAVVHDALAVFDPTSPEWLDGSVDPLPGVARTSFIRTVIGVRAGIRQFLKWQQEPNGQWRLYGRGSGIEPDAGTTSWSALAVTEAYDTRSSGRLVDAVMAFRAPSARFVTFVGEEGDDERLGADDVAVNAEVLRFLLASGMGAEAEPVRTALVHHFTGRDVLGATSSFRPNPLGFTYPLSRIATSVTTGGLSDVMLEPLTAALRLLDRPGGPLSRVLAATALLALDPHASEIDVLARGVMRDLRRGGAHPDDHIVEHVSSDVATTALQMALIGRRTHGPHS